MNNKVQNAKFIKNMVESASPEQLIVILYDGAIQWLNMAKNEIKVNGEKGTLVNWTDFSHQTKKATLILDHLQDSLDFSADEEFAERLYSLYDYLKSQIMKAGVKKDSSTIDEVIRFLQDIRKEWAQAIKDSKNKTTSSTSTVYKV